MPGSAWSPCLICQSAETNVRVPTTLPAERVCAEVSRPLLQNQTFVFTKPTAAGAPGAAPGGDIPRSGLAIWSSLVMRSTGLGPAQ